jgi:hypothetical protein
MDPTVTEAKVGTPKPNNQRACWAAKTLVAEVREVFPETPVEYSNYDGRNTALDVMFDLTGLDPQDAHDLALVLELLNDTAYNEDQRIDTVIAGGGDQKGQVLVSFKSSPRTQDNREPFGILDALSVLSGKDEFDYGEESDGIDFSPVRDALWGSR